MTLEGKCKLSQNRSDTDRALVEQMTACEGTPS